MTAPRPFAEVVEELTRLCVPGTVIDGHQYIQIRQALPRLLSRLASREAVFEAAVAWEESHQRDYDSLDTAYAVLALRAAIASAQADEEQPCT